MEPLELTIFAVSAFGFAGCCVGLSRLWCQRVCPLVVRAWELASSAEDELHDDYGCMRSIRLQVSTAVGFDALDDTGEFEDMVVDVTRSVRTVGDVVRTPAERGGEGTPARPLTSAGTSHARRCGSCGRRSNLMASSASRKAPPPQPC